jgi:hypothetical protein
MVIISFGIGAPESDAAAGRYHPQDQLDIVSLMRAFGTSPAS